MCRGQQVQKCVPFAIFTRYYTKWLLSFQYCEATPANLRESMIRRVTREGTRDSELYMAGWIGRDDASLNGAFMENDIPRWRVRIMLKLVKYFAIPWLDQIGASMQTFRMTGNAEARVASWRKRVTLWRASQPAGSISLLHRKYAFIALVRKCNIYSISERIWAFCSFSRSQFIPSMSVSMTLQTSGSYTRILLSYKSVITTLFQRPSISTAPIHLISSHQLPSLS
jgi:hypothetical protein